MPAGSRSVSKAETGPDDVRWIATGDLRRERVIGSVGVQDELTFDLDVAVRFVEVVDDLLLDLDLGRIVASAQAAIPADQFHAGRNWDCGATMTPGLAEVFPTPPVMPLQSLAAQWPRQ